MCACDFAHSYVLNSLPRPVHTTPDHLFLSKTQKGVATALLKLLATAVQAPEGGPICKHMSYCCCCHRAFRLSSQAACLGR